MKKTITTLVTSGLVLSTVHATSIISHVTGTSGISTTDLLHNVAPSSGVMTGSAGYTAAETTFTDGLVGGPNSQLNWIRDGINTFDGSSGASGFLEYTLDTSVNTAGYDISTLAIYTGFFGTGFNQLNVEVFTRKVGAGSFVSTGNFSSDQTGAGSTTLTIGNFATDGAGIEAIRFEFNDVSGNDGMLSDIDLFGTPAVVPEPSTTALLGLGGLALILRRRK